MTDELYQPSDTSIRWFAPRGAVSILTMLNNSERAFAWSGKHGEPTRVPVPVGQKCSVCDRAFDENGYGYTLPHVSMNEPTQDRPYHMECLWRMLGLERFLGEMNG